MWDAIARLADRFALAAMNGEEWLPALTALAEATGSSRGELVGIDPTGHAWFNWITDFPQEALDAFAGNYGPLSNTRVRVSLEDPAMVIRSEVDYRAVPNDAATRFYADFCHQVGIPNGCQTKLAEDGSGMIGLAVLRTEREGATRPEDRALFAAVAPFVKSAVRTQMLMERQGAMLMNGLLDRLSAAAFVCGADGAIHSATPAAEALLATGRLRRSNGRLAAPRMRDDLLLQRALARHGGGLPQPLETLVIGIEPGELPIVMDISALPRSSYRITPARDLLVIARDARRWHAAAGTILATVYRLSAAEIDVALRLARGQTREAIAADRGTSLETVRAQLKAIFAKLGVGREAEMIVMLGDLLRI